MRLDLYRNLGEISTERILDAIGIEENGIPRIRGVGIDEGKILIHTRTGGGNREQYDTKELFADGEYGIQYFIDENKNALTDFEDYRWHITVWSEKDFDDWKEFWKVPYEAQYRYPETTKEWNEKRKDILKSIEELEEQKRDVLLTAKHTNEYLTTNKYYLSDEDDDFDSTYANFWFRIPDSLLKELGALEDPVAKAMFGDAHDYIKGVIGGDKDAQDRIVKRIEEAEEQLKEAKNERA